MIQDGAHAFEKMGNLCAVDRRISSMKSSTKDKIQGNIDQAKGSVQEKAGRATNDPEMEDRGAANRVGGKIQEKVGDIKKVFEK